MIKIAFCTNSTGILGGREKVFADKINYLISSTKFDIYIITRSQGKKHHFYPLNMHADKCFDLNINYENIDNKNPIIRFIKRNYLMHKHKVALSNIINIIQPDIVVINSPEDVFIINGLPQNIRTLYEEHNIINYFTHNLLKQYHKGFVLKICQLKLFINNIIFEKKLKELDRIICLTKIAKQYHDIANNITVLGNPLGEEYKKKSIHSKQNKIIAVGRLSAEKRFHLFIEVCNQICNKLPNWTFHIYGEGSEYNRLNELIRKFKLQETLFIHKNEYNMLQAYQEASICVITSLFESYCMVLTEAMSQEVACVSFAIAPGPKELISNNVNGILVSDGNVQEMSEAILKLANNKQLRKDLARNGVRYTSNLFMDNIMPDYISILSSLIKKS